MDAPTNQWCHSADVRIHLHVNDHVLEIAQLGPDFCILRMPIDLSPSEGEITMSVNGRERRWRVRLLEGINSDQAKTAITRCAPVGRHSTQ
jgi:hypothetical protein